LVLPRLDKAILGGAALKFATRQSADLNFEGFEMRYAPKLRLRIAGRGAAVNALASQALQSGFEVHLQSPEVDMHNDLAVTKFDHLTSPAAPPPQRDDPWTAVILMFHDHDWEAALLAQALKGDAFYIGAMGSARTHTLRKDVLTDAGISAADIARIHGPIGLIPSMRDANLLGLSALAEIVKTAQDCGRL
jgi:xanthine dehydrogenase accessory factor